ncbi:MAG TPA: HAD family phosphatase [Micromonosporaceae bacterium]|nr:HAD family phosphatase [Micromonosporaceae bacterium]
MGPLSRKHLRGVLLDLDGTLLDSEPTHRAAFESMFTGRNWDVDPDVYTLFTGRRARDVFTSTPGPWAGEDPDALVAEVLDHLAESEVPPEPVDGAPALIRDWHARGVPIALVTSATRLWAEYAVEEILGVRECFSALVTWEDVTHGKPHPAPFIAGCRALHVDPAEATAVEDSVAGVTAAVAAGIGRVVAVTATTDHQQLRAAGAHQVVDSLDELSAH